jgi:ATP-dependent Lon protease
VQEKVAIAERYLVPKAVSEAGLSEVLPYSVHSLAISCPEETLTQCDTLQIKVNFQREALHRLIHSYAREAVRAKLTCSAACPHVRP